MRVWEEGRNEKRSKDKGIRSDPHVLASRPSLIRVDMVEFVLFYGGTCEGSIIFMQSKH